MLTKNQLKYTASLLQKKHRNLERKFLVEGKKLVEEALLSGWKVEQIICTNQFAEDESGFLQTHNIQPAIIKQQDFNKISDTKTPQGITAVVNKKEPAIAVVKPGNVIAALEDISDPGNVGTILRNADWFGIRDVMLSRGCAEVYNPKTVRSSMGSLFHLTAYDEIHFYKELELLKKKGYAILCADMDGENLYEYTFPEKCIIVLCNEANGPTAELLNLADTKITIPKFGKAESLNVANASAVILSEYRR